jgi:hypothetical protein
MECLTVILIILVRLFVCFWIFAFGIGALASVFAMLASIIHFQILGALGFFILAIICGVIAATINYHYSPTID